MVGIPEFGTNFVRGMVDQGASDDLYLELLQLSGFSWYRRLVG